MDGETNGWRASPQRGSAVCECGRVPGRLMATWATLCRTRVDCAAPRCAVLPRCSPEVLLCCKLGPNAQSHTRLPRQTWKLVAMLLVRVAAAGAVASAVVVPNDDALGACASGRAAAAAANSYKEMLERLAGWNEGARVCTPASRAPAGPLLAVPPRARTSLLLRSRPPRCRCARPRRRWRGWAALGPGGGRGCRRRAPVCAHLQALFKREEPLSSRLTTPRHQGCPAYGIRSITARRARRNPQPRALALT